MLTFISNPEQYVLPDLLDQDGSLRLMPASEYDKIEQPALQIWCHHNTRYGLPTTELVEWIQNRIGNRAAIEIGSGCGDLAKHLGIPGTDSKVQEKKWVQDLYRLSGNKTIFYPGWVKRLDALSAIERYEPQVVVASWVTQWVDPNIFTTEKGCVAGVKEDELLAIRRRVHLCG